MKRLILLTLIIASCISCMKNPLSYPRDKAEITAFEVEGQKSVTIDPDNLTVNIVLDESADLDSVYVKTYEFTDTAVPDVELPAILDLRDTVSVAFSTYPDQVYVWNIIATQPINRYVKCDGLIGDPEFDLENKTILAYFPEDQDLKQIRFTKMKLEAKGSQIDSTFGFVSIDGIDTPTKDKMEFPMTLDCVISRKFRVHYRHETTEWTFTAVHKIIELEITSVNAWCYRADINAVFKGKGSPVIQYRESGEEEWTALNTTVEGTNITASVEQLTEGTSYVARVVNGDSISEEFSFTTETPEQLPNMSFDDWYQGDPGGYTWYPNVEGSNVWGTANSGVNMMSAVNSTRPEYTFVAKKGGAAVRMESVYVFGKFAAGNIYTGQFGKAVLSPVPGAELDWGVPFTTRPYSMKGFYSYSPKKIDYASDKYEDKKGTMDKAQILVFLTDWDKPFLVSTSTETFVDLEKDPNIIALGVIETDEDTQGKYVEFECVLEYRNDRKPKYIVAVACSSLYGDYFTGGQGSVMYVDEWEFMYK